MSASDFCRIEQYIFPICPIERQIRCWEAKNISVTSSKNANILINERMRIQEVHLHLVR